MGCFGPNSQHWALARADYAIVVLEGVVVPHDLELTSLETALTELVLGAPAPGKHCARSAVRHLRGAWKILDLDPEMAAFRGITAEEEAASAVFDALRRRRYAGAERLKPRDHLHKNALGTFTDAVGHFLSKNPLSDRSTQIVVEPVDGVDRLRIRIDREGSSGDRVWAYPVPPLHGSISLGEQPYDFGFELSEIAELKQHSSIRNQLRAKANRRNSLLYATAQGVRSASNIPHILENQRHVTFRHIAIYLMIDPYREKQQFVQQCLQAFLRMMEMLPGDIVFE
jgi:hypothetical protein